MINDFVAAANGFLWGSVLIYALVAAGLWFTWRLGAIQCRHFLHMFSVLRHSRRQSGNGISSFQALCTTLAARVGTGNLAGVAVAISLGGAGAVFWMWVIAFVGMATAFAESTLGQLYKHRQADGSFRGGPAAYMRQGVGSPALAVLFSACLFFGYGFVFSSVQANSISDAFAGSFGFDRLATGLVITLFAGIIVLGGLRQIARFAELAVPIMGIAYVAVALAVLALNLEQLPRIFADIIGSAFGWREAGSGLVGAAIVQGIKRGLYSNEAGMGSAPNAAAAAEPYPPHPASQGYVQMLGVFLDTIVICSCTAFVILLADTDTQGMAGIQMTQSALVQQLGAWGADFISVAIFFFAFTSIVANYAYADNNLGVLRLDNRPGKLIFRAGFLAMVLYGSVATLPEVIAMADLAVALMTMVNLVALLWLSKTVVALARDYNRQLDAGELPHYQPDKATRRALALFPGVWKTRRGQSASAATADAASEPTGR